MAKAKKRKLKLPTIPWEKVGKLSKLHKMIIFFGTVAILGGPFVYLVYMPQQEDIKRLERIIKDKRGELAKIKKTAANIGAFEEKLKETRAAFSEAQQMLPRDKEIPSLLTNISGLGSDAGLDFILFKPEAERPKGFYADIPVSIQVIGFYHRVAIFLDNVSKLERIVNVSNLSMRSPKVTPEGVILSTNLTATTYKFVEKKEAPKTKKKGRP